MKSHVNLYIDTEILVELKAKHVNISKVTSGLLRSYLDLPKKELQAIDASEKEKLEYALAEAKNTLAQLESKKQINLKLQQEAERRLEHI